MPTRRAERHLVAAPLVQFPVDWRGPPDPRESTLRAVVCEQLGAPEALVLADLPVPEPGPGEALVAVSAAAVGFATGLIIAGRYQVVTPVPFVPGGEFSGRVAAVGPGVTEVGVGDEVMGFAGAGAFAEFTTAPAATLSPVPPGLSLLEAAAFPATYPTAYHALATVGEARPGEWVAVLGSAGGVGTACVDVATRLGSRVVALASTPARAERARAAGAVATVAYRSEDVKQRLREITGEGVDVVVDMVGGPSAEAALRSTRWRGRFVSVGFASGEIPRIPLNLVLLKGVDVRGFQLQMVHDRMPDAWRAGTEALGRLVDAGLRPDVGRVRALEDAPLALREVAEQAVTGRVVLDVSGG
jgi:NADPH2:quinone reductase